MSVLKLVHTLVNPEEEKSGFSVLRHYVQEDVYQSIDLRLEVRVRETQSRHNLMGQSALNTANESVIGYSVKSDCFHHSQSQFL